MKKILIMTSGMYSGGVEKALINMLNYIPRQEYEITILLLKMEGEFLPLLPKDVLIKEVKIKNICSDTFITQISLKRLLYNSIKNGDIKKMLKAIYNRIILRDYFFYLPERIENLKNEDSDLDREYDLAICYHMHCPFNLAYVAKKVKALKKIAWIHNDFKTTGFPLKKLGRYLKSYDQFYVVSKQLKEEFLEVMSPRYRSKVDVFMNIISPCDIIRQSEEYVPAEYMDHKGLTLLSIGRLTSQKGFDMAIKVCRKLREAARPFTWYVIGEGQDRSLLEQAIIQNDVSDMFKLLGLRSNPYPYMKYCDIYIQPSRHEGYCTTITEARILNKPIICTDFVGALEQITNDVTGKIVRFSEEELAGAIKELMACESKRNQFAENLKKDDMNKSIPEQEIKRLLKI